MNKTDIVNEEISELVDLDDEFIDENERSWHTIATETANRLDVFIASEIVKTHPQITRSFIQNGIKKDHAMINHKIARAKDKVKIGDFIEFRWLEKQSITALPENLEIQIVYQDADIAVINKQVGLVVHPAPGHETGTLVNALLFHLNDLSGIGGEMRPGIVHRIDKGTSGLLVVAKSDLAHQSLCAQIADRTMKRKYIALIAGYLPDQLTIDAPIGRSSKDRKKMAVTQNGREARTHIETLETYAGFSLLRCELETGRTHQIRVHLAYKNHPIVGDLIYGGAKEFGMNSQALHAYELSLIHPRTQETMTFHARPPEIFIDAIQKMREQNGLQKENSRLGF